MPQQAHGIDRGHIAHVNTFQVARGEVEVLVDVFGDDQDIGEVEGFEFLEQGFGFGSVDFDLGGNNETVLPEKFGDDTAHRSLVHLAVYFLRMVLRLRRKSLAPAAPDRTADGPGTCTTRTFLAIRFTATSSHLGAIFLRTRPTAPAREIRHHYLVHQRLVEIAGERRVRNFDGAVAAIHRKFHTQRPLRAQAVPAATLTAGLT